VVIENDIGERARAVLAEGDVADRIVEQVVGEHAARNVGPLIGARAATSVKRRPTTDVQELGVGDRNGTVDATTHETVTVGNGLAIEPRPIKREAGDSAAVAGTAAATRAANREITQDGIAERAAKQEAARDGGQILARTVQRDPLSDGHGFGKSAGCGVDRAS